MDDDDKAFEEWWKINSVFYPSEHWDQTIKDRVKEAFIGGWDAYASTLEGGV
jgi:hypothetical protein